MEQRHDLDKEGAAFIGGNVALKQTIADLGSAAVIERDRAAQVSAVANPLAGRHPQLPGLKRAAVGGGGIADKLGVADHCPAIGAGRATLALRLIVEKVSVGDR